jgi:beta-phosphoglucomutase-like phosphatase (HAD superfamily)
VDGLQAIAAVLAEYGQVYDEELRSHIIGRDEVEGANIVINAKKLPLGPHEFLRKREALLKELFPTAQPMPGTTPLYLVR